MLINHFESKSKLIIVPESETTQEMDLVVTKLVINGNTNEVYWVHRNYYINACVFNGYITGTGGKKYQYEVMKPL